MSNLYNTTPEQIVMYTTEFCGDCVRAKAFFDANNIKYTSVSLEGNEQATEFVLQMNNGNRTVPTIIFPDGTVLSEPTWEELRQKTAVD